jgi:ubiquinone/menaquinone biosynthesis C-methylase UbiE
MPATSKLAIRRNYDEIAAKFDLAELLPELLAVRRLRRELLQRAAGKVLEIGVGTGKNLPFYPQECEITAVDMSAGMMARARRRAAKLGRRVNFLLMDAEALGFPDGSFDTVVDSLNLCTFVDRTAALEEMARVCRPEGRILLLEHGRSDRGWLGRWQDRHAEKHAKRLGCRWNLEPPELVRQARLPLRRARRTFLGVFHLMEVTPPARP